MTTAIIIARPSPSRHGYFDAIFDGQPLCTSRQPFLDGARVLLARGLDPTTRLIMRHAGSDIDALAGQLASAARLTVEERARQSPRIGLWAANCRFAVQPPIEFS